jgi:hypothetical protein
MSQEGSPDYQRKVKALEMLKHAQETEASLNWTRNSYFLVVLSLLTLAYSQKPVDNIVQLTIYQVLIASIGVVLSVIWLLIQQRSSQYIEYYKNESRPLAKETNTPDFYPKNLKGVEMRKLVYALPIGFLALSLAFIIMQVYFLAYPLPASILSLTPTPIPSLLPTPLPSPT